MGIFSKLKPSFGSSASKHHGASKGSDEGASTAPTTPASGDKVSPIRKIIAQPTPMQVKTVVPQHPKTKKHMPHDQLPTIIEPDVPKSGNTTLAAPASPPRTHSPRPNLTLAPPAPSAALFDNGQIEKIWKDVEERVLRLAGNSENFQRNLDIDEALLTLESVKKSDEKAAEKHSSIKRVFSTTLKCIENVGSNSQLFPMVSHTQRPLTLTIQVFAPAPTCYNALIFVIQAWHGYEGIFEHLADLLEKCSDFLDRLPSYTESKMDAKITIVACQQLELFVEICDHSIRMRTGKAKAEALAKQLFLNDNDSKGLLTRMEQLSQKESRLVSAQHFAVSNRMACDVAFLTIAIRQVQRKLGVKDSSLRTEPPVDKAILDSWDLSFLLDEYTATTNGHSRYNWRLSRQFNWRGHGLSRFAERTEQEQLPYTLSKVIGIGGEGVLTQVECQGRSLALKLVMVEAEQTSSEKVIREGLLLAKIKNQHIVQIVGAFSLEQRPLMGFGILLYPVAQTDLDHYLEIEHARKTKFWIRTITSNVGCLANAVAYLHSHEVGISHMDIKPSNILVKGPNMLLSDFGISVPLGRARRTFNPVYGTLAFLPPECRNSVSKTIMVGYERDIFQLGLTFSLMMDALTEISSFPGRNSSETFEASSCILKYEDFNFNYIVGRLVNNAFPFNYADLNLPPHSTSIQSTISAVHDDDGSLANGEERDKFISKKPADDVSSSQLSDNDWSAPDNSNLLEQYYDLDSCFTAFIRLMTAREPKDRPTAALVSAFFKYVGWAGLFCGDCCRGPGDICDVKKYSNLLAGVKRTHEAFAQLMRSLN